MKKNIRRFTRQEVEHIIKDKVKKEFIGRAERTLNCPIEYKVKWFSRKAYIQYKSANDTQFIRLATVYIDGTCDLSTCLPMALKGVGMDSILASGLLEISFYF